MDSIDIILDVIMGLVENLLQAIPDSILSIIAFILTIMGIVD